MNEKTSRHYDTAWSIIDGVRVDVLMSEDLRPCAADYLRRSQLRLMSFLGTGEKLLDFGSGPVDTDVKIAYSSHYDKRYCVDFSREAIESSRTHLGEHGEYFCDDFLKIEFPNDFFDATVASYSLYHVEADLQETTVRKLLQHAKPRSPVIITYANPNDLVDQTPGLRDFVKSRFPPPAPDVGSPYYHAHPLSWWDRFRREARIMTHPMRLYDAPSQLALVPDGEVGKQLLTGIESAEIQNPRLFANLDHHYFVVLRKKHRP
jgi:hypothetical protein